MRVLPDTPVWAAAFRRGGDTPNTLRRDLERLVVQGVVELIGPIRQEVLSGIRDRKQHESVRERLRFFPDLPILTEDYEEAASYYSICKAKGIQGSSTDFLICAVAARNGLAIFTDDRDFLGYRRVLGVELFGPLQ
jgi:hypothetical protein